MWHLLFKQDQSFLSPTLIVPSLVTSLTKRSPDYPLEHLIAISTDATAHGLTVSATISRLGQPTAQVKEERDVYLNLLTVNVTEISGDRN